MILGMEVSLCRPSRELIPLLSGRFHVIAPDNLEAGARAYLKDVPNSKLYLIDAGHFAVEKKPVEIAKSINLFLLENILD
jgi:pimeloyl-ACP methyl ester carboxylesterase